MRTTLRGFEVPRTDLAERLSPYIIISFLLVGAVVSATMAIGLDLSGGPL